MGTVDTFFKKVNALLSEYRRETIVQDLLYRKDVTIEIVAGDQRLAPENFKAKAEAEALLNAVRAEQDKRVGKLQRKAVKIATAIESE